MALSSEIKKRREALGWSQNRLATEAGVQQPTLQRIESGTRADPSVSIVLAIARALGSSVEDLVGPTPRANHPESFEARVAALEDGMVTALRTAGDALALAQQIQRDPKRARTRRAAL